MVACMIILYVFFIIFLILSIFYLGIGFIPYQISKIYCDYPGPKEISSNNVLTGNVDYLLVHGAVADARVWRNILKRNSDKSMVAISLSRHQDGVKYANPYNAAADLVQYLKNHKINRAIIGHSTASLWISEAYFLYPEVFKDIQVILLAPNFGSNIYESDLHMLSKWNRLSWILPSLIVKPGNIDSCVGDKNYSYEQAKDVYSYGRLFLFNSRRYYNDLVNYSFSKESQDNLDKFLKNNKNNITVYISHADKALDPENTIKVVQKYNLNNEILSDVSHVMLTNIDKIWLRDKIL